MPGTEPETSNGVYISNWRHAIFRKNAASCLRGTGSRSRLHIAYQVPVNDRSMQPKTYILFNPEEPSSVSALFYIERGIDVYGWYAHAVYGTFSAAFFMLENFYASHSTALYRSIEDDVYGPWINDVPPVDAEIRCPLPEPIRHELERIQSTFVDEWLFFENDPAAAHELHAYASHQLQIHAVNIKSRKLNRLDKGRANWEHRTVGLNPAITDFVQKYWRLDEKIIPH
jgi:hypothetical protein